MFELIYDEQRYNTVIACKMSLKQFHNWLTQIHIILYMHAAYTVIDQFVMTNMYHANISVGTS